MFKNCLSIIKFPPFLKQQKKTRHRQTDRGKTCILNQTARLVLEKTIIKSYTAFWEKGIHMLFHIIMDRNYYEAAAEVPAQCGTDGFFK